MKQQCKIQLKHLMLFLSLLLTINVSAEELRYVQTGYIDKYGERHEASSYQASMVITVDFRGSYAIKHTTQLSTKYRFHHNDGANSVYYMINTNPNTGEEMWLESNIMVVSPSRNLINMHDYFQGQRSYTIIYEQQDADSYGAMSR